MHLKGQLHIHTTCSDGRLTPQQAADTYALLGYDFIAISDHDHLLKPGYRKAVESIHSNMLILFGIERTVGTRWGYVHVTEIEGQEETLYTFNHPSDYGFTIRQTLDCIEDVSRTLRVDAVEVSHHGFYTPDYDRDVIPFPKVATDDSHTAQSCGRAWVELDCERSKDDIIRAIKRGDAKPCFVTGVVHKSAIVIA